MQDMPALGGGWKEMQRLWQSRLQRPDVSSSAIRSYVLLEWRLTSSLGVKDGCRYLSERFGPRFEWAGNILEHIDWRWT